MFIERDVRDNLFTPQERNVPQRSIELLTKLSPPQEPAWISRLGPYKKPCKIFHRTFPYQTVFQQIFVVQIFTLC
jgi:hypothetical protein